MIMHPPPNELLADYASGAASPGIALLVAAHLTHAPDTRRRVAQLESVGGALLADELPATMSAGALDAALSRIDAGADLSPPCCARAHDQGPLPRPVIDAVGRNFDEIPWRFVLPGVSEHVLEGYGSERVSLLRARPGWGVPQHTHQGRELTLILTGQMEDGHDIYRAGDVAVCDETHDHRPKITGSEICHCLIVLDGSLRFTGTFSRALNILAE